MECDFFFFVSAFSPAYILFDCFALMHALPQDRILRTKILPFNHLFASIFLMALLLHFENQWLS